MPPPGTLPPPPVMPIPPRPTATGLAGGILPPPPGPPSAVAPLRPPAPASSAPPPLPREVPPAEAPDAKRQRLEFVLQPEEEFLEQYPGPSKVQVQCPEVEGNEKLIGQLLQVEVASLKDSVGHLKSRLANTLDLAANKQTLNREGVGFLRDELSLAHYNIGPDIVLTLGTRQRGGRKK